MQSIMQYGRLKANLKEQIQRHGLQKVASVARRGENTEEELQRENGIQQFSNHGAITHTNVRDFPNEEKEIDGGRYDDSHLPRAANAISNTEDTRVSQIDVTLGDTDMARAPTTNADLRRSDSRVLRAMGTRLGRFMTGVSVKSRRQHDSGTEAQHYFVVSWQGSKDQLNPHNWPYAHRVVYTLIVASISLLAGLASSILSAAIPQARQELQVSEVVESLATGMYLIGFGCGAFFAAPFSETVGRNPVYLGTGIGFMIFTMASALAPNIGAQLAFQFLAGIFGSTPLTCAGGSISDMWTAAERTAMFPVFANSAFWGPILGPVVGGWIAQSPQLSWRWCEWITLIWAGVTFTLATLILPETYTPVLLKWKAQHLRALTGDNRYMSALEVSPTTFIDRLVGNLTRPWILILTEPIVIMFTLYLTVVYIVLFTFLTGFEFIFTDTYQLSQGLTSTIFLALGVGFLCCSALVPWIVTKYNREEREAKDRGELGLPPEQRLIFAMVTAPFLPIGLFWTAWTSYESISVWSPIISMIPVGSAILGIFISTYQYLIDAFEMFSASALVGITFVRYLAAGGMIPVSIPFYKNLGVHWTLTILGVISAIMVPVPYMFFLMGARVRARSRHAVGAGSRK